MLNKVPLNKDGVQGNYHLSHIFTKLMQYIHQRDISLIRDCCNDQRTHISYSVKKEALPGTDVVLIRESRYKSGL